MRQADLFEVLRAICSLAAVTHVQAQIQSDAHQNVWRQHAVAIIICGRYLSYSSSTSGDLWPDMLVT